MEAEIEHFVDGSGHGPIAIFLSDSGQVAFVCRRDGALWQGTMHQTIPAAQDAAAPQDGEVLADGPSARLRPDARRPAAPEIMSMSDALHVARSHLG